jgi:hypothetical protein
LWTYVLESLEKIIILIYRKLYDFCISINTRAQITSWDIQIYPVEIYPVEIYPVENYPVVIYPVEIYGVEIYPVEIYPVEIINKMQLCNIIYYSKIY